jgi:peptide/nickel transport system substrate-binding protein
MLIKRLFEASWGGHPVATSNNSFDRRPTRRAVLRLVGASAAFGLLAACGPAPAASTPTQPPAAPKPTAAQGAPTAAAAATSAPAAQPTVAQAAQVKTGGTLTFGQNVEIASGGQAGQSPLDGQNISPAPLSALWLGFDTLIAYDDQMKPQPMLAESWDVSTDRKSVKLTLRKGVTFHSGRDFTSDDVSYNLMRVRQPNVGAQFTNMSKWWTSIETPDKSTVVLTSDQPRPAMFDLFEMLNMVDRELVEGPDYLKKSGSTGPFKFAEYVQGDHIRWMKNTSYWQSGKPYLDEVVIKFFGDAQAMVTQLEAGVLDGIDSPPTRDSNRLKSDSKYKVLVNDISGQYWVLVANTTAGPTAEPKFRQALNYAIDRSRFITTALAGVGDPEDLPWLASSPAFDAAKRTRYAFDLDKARSLVAEAGASNASIDYLYNGVVPELATFGQVYQADLAKIGVTLNLKGVERAVYNDLAAKFQYGVLMSNSGFANFDPATLPLVSRYWDPNNNLAGMNANDAYKQAVASVSVEGDPTKRKPLLDNLNDIILDQSFSVPIAPAKHQTITRANVNGFRWHAVESIDWTGVWKS